jgi:hypothetical protein
MTKELQACQRRGPATQKKSVIERQALWKAPAAVRLSRLIAVLAALSSLDLATAFAATLVVDDDGLATRTNCDASAPFFKKIHLAVNAAAPGDTIQVCSGVYITNRSP